MPARRLLVRKIRQLQDSSDIDLLVVLTDGDSAEPERMCFDICEAIACQPRTDVAVAFEKEVREAASALHSGSEEGSCSTTAAGCVPALVSIRAPARGATI